MSECPRKDLAWQGVGVKAWSGVPQRRIRVFACEPLQAGLPGARSLVVIERTRTCKDDEEPSIAYDLTSHPPGPGCARRLGDLARGHWGGCESRHHWVRDACMREDRTRSRYYSLNCNLSALRVCLVAIKADLHPDSSFGPLVRSAAPTIPTSPTAPSSSTAPNKNTLIAPAGEQPA